MPNRNSSFDPEFEKIWSAKPIRQWIACAPSHLQAEIRNNKKMNSWGDWLLYLPIIFLALNIDRIPVQNGILKWLIFGLLAAILLTLSTFLKPFLTGKRSANEIQTEIKAYFYNEWKSGRLPHDEN